MSQKPVHCAGEKSSFYERSMGIPPSEQSINIILESTWGVGAAGGLGWPRQILGALATFPLLEFYQLSLSLSCFGLWSLVSRLWPVVGQWSLVSGLWSLVAGLGSLVSGVWPLVSGLWSLSFSLVSGRWSLGLQHVPCNTNGWSCKRTKGSSN